MDTPRTPRDNLRTSPGLEDLEDVGRLEAPLLPRARQADSSEAGSASELPAVTESKRCVPAPCMAVDGAAGFGSQPRRLCLPSPTAHAITSATPHRPRPHRILGIGAPLVLEEVLAFLSTIISVAYAGRLGGYSLGVFTLSHALTNITGWRLRGLPGTARGPPAARRRRGL